MIESEGDVMKILPKAYDCAPGCRYIVGYICVYPGANLGIHIMSLDSKVYVTNAPYGTLAGDIFLIGDVILTIDNIPVTTVKLCSTNIKDALCTKGWCRVLIERPVTQFAKQRTKNALKAEKCLEIDPKMPEDIMGICTQFLQNTAKSSQIEATTTKGILKDRINPNWKSGRRVAISQQSEEVPVGCDPYNIDLMQQVEKRSEVPYQRKKNSSGVKKKSKLSFFGRKTAEENNNNP
uniref:PDZ domain-containing protein n=1 Tax=Panagrolaimus sp. PS1159 TaxID=55785 RepID=A0AC35FI47_9BILA